MASSYKVLGQLAPSAGTLSNLYITPASTQTVVSTLTIANTGTSATQVRVAVRPAGNAIAIQHYCVYDVAINAGDVLPLTLGLTLGATDVVSVYSLSGNVSFGLFGSEIV
jgi:hypothetical protein